MIDLTGVKPNPISESIVNVLTTKCRNPESTHYFRTLTAFWLCQMASSMRTSILTKDRGEIPVNMYALMLATSGMGKGYSNNILEHEVFHEFRERFTQLTFPYVSEENLKERAATRAAMSGEPEEVELDSLKKEFRLAGAMPYSFDSGTAPAFKQVRHKALLAGIGSLNFICDEIGTNILNNAELLAVYLEAYDVGRIKQKLTKNTSENQRAEEISGAVPTNMMLYGTPSKVLNGGKEESELISYFETGYGRRCHYALGYKPTRTELTAEELYEAMISDDLTNSVEDIAQRFGELADPAYYNTTLELPKEVAIKLIEYRLACEEFAETLPEHEEIRKAEIEHRYYKAMKVAGAYAFAQGNPEITMDNLMEAILLTEESGKALELILTRDKNYVRLAKYLANCGKTVTHADMVEELPFYRGSNAVKQDMLQLASAWAYPRHIVIKKHYISGIEFFSGEKLKENNLSEIKVSYSDKLAEDYQGVTCAWEDLSQLTQADGYHWCNHHFVDEHRKEDKAKAGFNILVLDVDNDDPNTQYVSVELASKLLEEYTHFIYTTKRHSKECNRFRIVLPISHELKLDAQDYRDFMQNLNEWLPFKIDDKTFQRAKKWLSNSGDSWYNEGLLLDALQFIPKTTKNEERIKNMESVQSMDNLQRWFVKNTATGNRSDHLIRYALILVEAGQDFDTIRTNVLDMNSKLPEPMEEVEIYSTIMSTVSKRIQPTN